MFTTAGGDWLEGNCSRVMDLRIANCFVGGVVASFGASTQMFTDMAAITSSVKISFMPLLEDLCCVLATTPPEYRVSVLPGSKTAGETTECVYVTVKLPPSLVERTFTGSGKTDVKACYELAARRMTVFLVKEYRVMVYDINLALRTRNEHCAQLYGCLFASTFRVERALPPAQNYEIEPVEGLDWGRFRIEIDFLALLRVVVEEYNVAVTPMYVLPMGADIHRAWLGISVPGSQSPSHGMLGYKASTIEAAKQTLAKEVITLLSLWHRFEVKDVNYYLLPFSSHFMDAERGVCDLIRERVYGLATPAEPQPAITEQDCTTPRGHQNRIPIMSHPPPPPRRTDHEYQPATATQAVPDCQSPDNFSL